MEKEAKKPEHFIKEILGRKVEVKLTNGAIYQG